MHFRCIRSGAVDIRPHDDTSLFHYAARTCPDARLEITSASAFSPVYIVYTRAYVTQCLRAEMWNVRVNREATFYTLVSPLSVNLSHSGRGWILHDAAAEELWKVKSYLYTYCSILKATF